MKIYFEPQTGRILDSPPSNDYVRHYYEVPFEARPILEEVAKKALSRMAFINYPDGFMLRVAELESAFKSGDDWRSVLDDMKGTS